MTKKSAEFAQAFKFPTGMKFADMTRKQKTIFVAKLLTCIATFGFVYPNVQND